MGYTNQLAMPHLNGIYCIRKLLVEQYNKMAAITHLEGVFLPFHDLSGSHFIPLSHVEQDDSSWPDFELPTLSAGRLAKTAPLEGEESIVRYDKAAECLFPARPNKACILTDRFSPVNSAELENISQEWPCFSAFSALNSKP